MRKTKDRLQVVLFLLVSILALAILTPHAHAAPDTIFNMSVIDRGTTYITWTYSDDDAITKLSIDGVSITNFDADAKNYTLSDLPEGSYHTLCGYSVDDSKCVTTNTTITPQNSSEKITDFFWQYIFIISALICIIIGVRVPFIALGGCGFAIIGLVSSISISFWSSFVFLVVFCAGVFVAFKPGD